MVKLALAGPGPLALVHLRNFTHIGAEVVAIIGASQERVEYGIRQLADIIQTPLIGLTSIEALKELDIDGLVICSPPNLHAQHIAEGLKLELPLFIEKPLVESRPFSSEDTMNYLRQITKLDGNKICVNTSNTGFLSAILDYIEISDPIDEFSFSFNTHGPFSYSAIGLDLLPHANSLLLALSGRQKINEFSHHITEKRFVCDFIYGAMNVSFNLSQDHSLPKSLVISVNNQNFSRIQRGRGETYQVSMKSEQTGHEIVVEDPFIVYAKRFLKMITSPAYDNAEQWALDLANVSLLCDIMTFIDRKPEKYKL